MKTIMIWLCGTMLTLTLNVTAVAAFSHKVSGILELDPADAVKKITCNLEN
jgi:hypothetical protein